MNGSCLCGAVAFSISEPAGFVVHCHCGICRRSHGAGFVTWLGVQNKQLTITKGTDQVKHFASSPGAKRSFCSECGSSMFFQAPRWPDEVHIALALVNDTDLIPTAHAFVDDKAPWTQICDGLKKLGGPTGTEPL